MVIQPKCYECKRPFCPNNALPIWHLDFSLDVSHGEQSLFHPLHKVVLIFRNFRKLEAAVSAMHLPTLCRGVSQRLGCVNSSGVPSHGRDAHRSFRGARTGSSVRQKTVLLSVKAQLDWSSTGLARKAIIGEEGFQYLAHHLSNRTAIRIKNALFPMQAYKKSLGCLLWLIPYFQWQRKCRLYIHRLLTQHHQ